LKAFSTQSRFCSSKLNCWPTFGSPCIIDTCRYLLSENFVQIFHNNGRLSCCLVVSTISLRYASSLSAAIRRNFSLARVSSKYPIWLSTSLPPDLLLPPLTALSEAFQRLPALSLLTLEWVLQL
jgi:hypothetical protein